VAEKDQGALMSKSELLIPPGRVYGQQRGETVTLLDGGSLMGQLCGPIEVGRKIAYCTDTVYCDGAVSLPRMMC